MTKRPPQVTCKCEARIFPHRKDQFCRILEEERPPFDAEQHKRDLARAYLFKQGFAYGRDK